MERKSGSAFQSDVLSILFANRVPPHSVEHASTRPEGFGVRTPPPSGRYFPGARFRCQPVSLPHASAALAVPPRRPFVRSDLGPTSVTRRPRGSRAFRPSHRSALGGSHRYYGPC